MVPQKNPQIGETPGALEGLRVIDQTQVMAGPFCSMLLADMGAAVIKVEPREGEYTRQERAIAPGVSASFLALNRNKRSLALDLKQPGGVEVLKKLAASADVLVGRSSCRSRAWRTTRPRRGSHRATPQSGCTAPAKRCESR